MNGENASDKAKRIVGRVIVETLEESGIAFVHASELCFLQLASKCADPEFEKAFNEILERVGNHES
jgi:hypothetical protein